MSVVTLMAAALEAELLRRGIFVVSPSGASTWVKFADCEAIISAIFSRGAELAQTYESSHPAPEPPLGQAPDGGCTSPSDASAVAFSSSAMPAPRTSDGGRAPSDAAPAVTPVQQAYALLWRDIHCESAAACKARHILLRSLPPAEQAAAITWVRRIHPFKDGGHVRPRGWGPRR